MWLVWYRNLFSLILSICCVLLSVSQVSSKFFVVYKWLLWNASNRLKLFFLRLQNAVWGHLRFREQRVSNWLLRVLHPGLGRICRTLWKLDYLLIRAKWYLVIVNPSWPWKNRKLNICIFNKKFLVAFIFLFLK